MASATAFAAVNWKQSQGTEIRFLMNKHPFTSYIEPRIPEFEKMTGIKSSWRLSGGSVPNKRTITHAGGKVDAT
jgi:hypothetical protein